jgi:hypothetical protein
MAPHFSDKILDRRVRFLHHSGSDHYPEGSVFQVKGFNRFACRVTLSVALLTFPATVIQAGGGLVLEGDVCIIWIDFYSAHFTAYQPGTSGNKQFCQDLPNTGETIFVLDYLHQSLKEVPVDFRIIRNVTGQGQYVKLKHVEEIKDIEQHTVFYQPPVVRPDASLQIEYDFKEKGAYVGIVSAGHPTTEVIYTAVFPFEVGASSTGYGLPLLLLLAGVVFFVVRRRFHKIPSSATASRQGMTQ